jgi:hypothetical protein
VIEFKRLPSLAKAVLLIMCDQGAINRLTTEKKELDRLRIDLGDMSFDVALSLDGWLATLGKQELEDLCVGEHEEAAKVMLGAPAHLRHVFEKILNTAAGA